MTYEEFVKRSKQKFLRGMRVHVAKNMPPSMRHFESNFEGIVIGSYGDMYHAQLIGGAGDQNYQNYSIAVLDKHKNKIVNSISWYWEDQLTLLNADIFEGILLLQEYGS